MDILYKIICSFPVILITLYYIPFLGVILILFRYFVNNKRKYYFLPICLIIMGLLILMPKIFYTFLNITKIKFNMLNITKIVESNIYVKLLNYSKLLISVGIIFLILSFLFRKLLVKLSNSLKNYLNKYETEQREIKEKNDLIVRERREKANNTHLVHCPNCGADNTIVGKIGKCKYCRKDIIYKAK